MALTRKGKQDPPKKGKRKSDKDLNYENGETEDSNGKQKCRKKVSYHNGNLSENNTSIQVVNDPLPSNKQADKAIKEKSNDKTRKRDDAEPSTSTGINRSRARSVNPKARRRIFKSPEKGGAVVEFELGDEIMTLQVDAAETSEFPDEEMDTTDDKGLDVDKEFTSKVGRSCNERTANDCEHEQSNASEGTSSGSVNNNAKIREIDAEETDEVTIDYEKIETEEIKSMMRFVKFLEQRGFICRSDDGACGSGFSMEQHGAAKSGKATGGNQAKLVTNVEQQRKKSEAISAPTHEHIQHDKTGRVKGTLSYLDKNSDNNKLDTSNSDLTVYKGAVELDVVNPSEKDCLERSSSFPLKRISTSSEECINTSDELEHDNELLVEHVEMVEKGLSGLNNEKGNDDHRDFQNFLDDQLREYRKGIEQQGNTSARRSHVVREEDNQQAQGQQAAVPVPDFAEIELKADHEIQQAKAAKARMNDITGKFAHSMFVDEDYSMMVGHIDGSLRMKILNSEYIDFVKLLPKDKIASDDEIRMELVNKNGMSYWVSADKEGSISSFQKWEQAFKIFSRIYTEKYPNRSTELIQYNYIISSAATSFVWDNVYAYDRDFRMHISKFPNRSWGVILQQAWTMRLRDRHGDQRNHFTGRGGNGHHGGNGNGSSLAGRNICYKFN